MATRPHPSSLHSNLHRHPPPPPPPLPPPLTGRRPTPPLLHLPPELLIVITSQLPWPDLLALKHTHPYFYHNTRTTVCQRLTWLFSLAPGGLDFPKGQVNMKTDADFCRSPGIRAFLKRRRWHLDCHWKGKNCSVIEGRPCPVKLTRVVKAFNELTKEEGRGLWPGWWVLSRAPLAFKLLWPFAVLAMLVAVLVALALDYCPKTVIRDLKPQATARWISSLVT